MSPVLGVSCPISSNSSQGFRAFLSSPCHTHSGTPVMSLHHFQVEYHGSPHLMELSPLPFLTPVRALLHALRLLLSSYWVLLSPHPLKQVMPLRTLFCLPHCTLLLNFSALISSGTIPSSLGLLLASLSSEIPSSYFILPPTAGFLQALPSPLTLLPLSTFSGR